MSRHDENEERKQIKETSMQLLGNPVLWMFDEILAHLAGASGSLC